ncbi:MAG: peptidoglycan-binding protein [Betaproteobacteria bacterium]
MKAGLRRVALISVVALGLASQGAGAALKLGSRGPSVAAVQGYLVTLGLLTGPTDGVYGPATREAVRAFQRREGLAVDGVVGAATLARLQAAATGEARTVIHRVSRGDTVYGIARRYGASPDRLIALNGLKEPRRLQPGQTLRVPVRAGALPAARPGKEGVELLPWPEANRLFPNGAVARVVDLRSGLAFWVQRFQGTYHADCEPVGFEDTAALKAAYGGAWSWDRHPIVVEVGGRQLAASMNGYPHGTGHLSRNGFPGHFCVHFYGSRTHGSRVVDPDHQAAILAVIRELGQNVAAWEVGRQPAPGAGEAEVLRTED